MSCDGIMSGWKDDSEHGKAPDSLFVVDERLDMEQTMWPLLTMNDMNDDGRAESRDTSY